MSPFFFSQPFNFLFEVELVRAGPSVHEVVTVSAQACKIVVIKALLPAVLEFLYVVHADSPSYMSVSWRQPRAGSRSFCKPSHTHLALIAVTPQDLVTFLLPCNTLVELLILIHSQCLQNKTADVQEPAVYERKEIILTKYMSCLRY